MSTVSAIGVLQNANTSAFGDMSAAQDTARIQLQFPYNINADEVTTTVTGSGTVTHSAPFAVCSTGAASSSSAKIESNQNMHYHPGQGGLVLFTTIFTPGVAGNTQLTGLGDATDGLFFGYNGTSFGINRRYGGTDNWIPQTTWNMDKMDGAGPSRMTLDTTKGNVFKIQYQWLGFGAINFFIENQYTGTFAMVHQLKYANQNTTTTLLNPSLPMYFECKNTSNTSNVVMKIPSFAAFMEGLPTETGNINAIYNLKSTITTETNIITIRNNTTFNSITNKKTVVPIIVSLTCTNNSDVTFRLILNTNLGGSPTYTNVNTNTSVVSYCTNGTTITGGRAIGIFFVTQSTSTTFSLQDYFPLRMNTGDTLTISATAVANSNPGAALTWSEEF